MITPKRAREEEENNEIDGMATAASRFFTYKKTMEGILSTSAKKQ
jgi:hypothetical protein